MAASEIGFSISERYNASNILFDNLARGRGAHVAVTGPVATLSYAELCTLAAQYGEALLDLGLERGDRVLLFLDDSPTYPAAFFGAIRAGLVPVLINTLTPSDLLQFYLQDTGARVAIVDSEFCDRFNLRACAGTQLRTAIISNGSAPQDSAISMVSASALLLKYNGNLVAADTHRDDMAFWQYSSGSTGRPKGIVHLQHDLAYTADSFSKHILKMTPDDVVLSIPKIFFAYGLGNSLTFPFCVGATAILLPGQPKAAPIYEAIRTWRPTMFFGLPTLYRALTNAPEAQTADLSSLKLCLSAAEVLSQDVADSWARLSGLTIVEGMGSTEVLHIYVSNSRDAQKPGSAGRRVPGYELKLVDRDGHEVGDNEEGILWVRGDSNAPLYWNRPDKTAETMKPDGWIYTGDRMVRDADGYYFFKGRADDLIKISGQWVYPLEVELCLAEHQMVRECAVMPVELDDKRMSLHAYVVLNEPRMNVNTARTTLQAYVKLTLLPYKYPRIMTFHAELPKTGTGKIDRQSLLRLLDD